MTIVFKHPASVTNPTITVGHKWTKGSVYIGRGSTFGNPYPVPHKGAEHLRTAACDNFEKYFWNTLIKNEEVVQELESLVIKAKNEGNVVLGCFCAPKRCHGETIKSYLDQRLAGVENPTKEP